MAFVGGQGVVEAFNPYRASGTYGSGFGSGTAAGVVDEEDPRIGVAAGCVDHPINRDEQPCPHPSNDLV